MYYETKEKINNALAITGITAFAVGFAGFLVHVPISVLVNEGQMDKADGELNAQTQQLNNTIAGKVNLHGFELASVELSHPEDRYTLKVFGSASVDDFTGMRQKQYINTYFQISLPDAYRIMDAVRKLETAPKGYKNTTGEQVIGVNREDVNDFLPVEGHRALKTKDIASEVYDAISTAVTNAYSYKMEEIALAHQFNKTLSDELGYTKSEVLSDVSGRWVSTSFVYAGVVTTGVSQVIKSEEKGVSYFYVDTLQGRAQDGKIIMESCRARVEIKGINLSQEEVYAKFILGEYDTFYETERELIGFEKVSTVDNKLVTADEELEFLV